MKEYEHPYLNYSSEQFWNFHIVFDGSSGSVSVSDMKYYCISHQIGKCIVTKLYIRRYNIDRLS